MTHSATKTAPRFQSQLRGDPKTKGPTQKLKCATQKPECTIQQPKLPKQKCHIFSITRHQIRLPPLNNTLHLEHYKTSSLPPPLNTMLHLQGHKTVALAPPLNTMLHLQHHKTSTSPPPSEQYVAPWDISPATPFEHQRPPLNTTSPLEDCKTSAPPPSLSTMLHLEHHHKTSAPRSLWTIRCTLSITRHQPRHPLWRLCCIFSITLGSLSLGFL